MPRNELYIGNLGRDVTRKDIEDIFTKYGHITRCDVKSKGFKLFFFLFFIYKK